MGRKRDDLWRYADRTEKGHPNRFKCKFCKETFPGGIVRLRSHLSGTKRKGIQVCNKVSREAKTAALAELEAANNKPFMKKTKPETSSSNSDGISVTLNENCRDEVDNLLAKFIELNDIDSSIVESPSFINLVNALLKPGFSNYVLPSCSTLENRLIPCIRNEVEQYVSTAKQSWKATGCTVIIDSWSNEKEKRSFISIIACANKMTVLVNTFEIPNNDLTCVFLETIVHSVVGSIRVDCIVQCIVDDTPFGEVFSEFLARKCPRLCIIRCANRELQSFFDEVEKEVEWIRTTFETAKSLVDSIYKEDDLLGLKQCSLGYDTLESILECKEELIKLVQSPEWLGQQESAKKVTEIIANPEFWEQGEEIQMVLNPLSKFLHFDDAFDSGFGYLYGLVKVASHAIASLHTENPVKYQKLWDIFESKKGKIMNQTHKVAAFLNPAYMCSQIVQESETDEAINYMLEKFVCDDDKVGFVYDAVNYRRTLSNTTQQFKIIAAKTFIPCKWWKEFGHEFSVLSKYAVRILSQPCGSSSLKSSLRSFRDNQIKHRGFMPDLNALNLRINHFLMDKFSAEKASQSKIINFEEFRQHKAMDDGSRNQVMEEARHSDEDTSLLLTSEEFIRSNGMKICFETTIASPIIVGQKVEGEQGSPIHVYLVDSVTNCVVQLPSMLTLTVSVLDGDFTNEGLSSSSSSSSDDGLCWTREHFDSNDLSSTMAAPLVTGDLQVMLQQGMGILGNFSFNYSSRDTRSGKFRLAVKTDAGNCQGIRTLEGISNAFVVEDCEVTTNQQLPTCDFNFPKDSDSSLNIFEPNEYWELESMLSDNSGPPVHWTPAWNNQLQCNTKSLTQTAAIKIKRKALKLSRMKKMRSRKTVGEEEREITVESTVSGDHHQVLERETTVKTTTVSGDHDQVLLNTKNNVDHQQCTKAVNDIVEHEIDPWKLSDMKIVLGRLVARLEWYKKEAADEDVGYYDIYKNMQRPKDNDVVLLKKTLDNYWANLIAEVNKKPQKADAKLRKTWVYNNGTVYRRMIEPLHIAEYYKEKKGRYVEEGRPKFLQELEMLTDSHIPADEDPITRRRAMMHYNLTEDSCFWAHVEEAKLSCESLISGSTDDGDREKKVLEEFEKYGFEQMRNHGVSKEIFLKESSFMRWWELYQQVLKGTHMGPDHDSPLIEFMRNERYEEYKKGIYAPWED